MVKAYVVNGLGIGCHEEVAHAFKQAGAEAEIVHIKQILSGDKKLSNVQILNFSGGFLHGDILGAGMPAANELKHSGIKDELLEFAEKGIIYGQCNGFQLLVKTGLLPGIDGDYSKQTLTLTHNDVGNYFVGFVNHIVGKNDHFAFQGLDTVELWCRHGEGKIQFYSENGLISKEEGEKNRAVVNEKHVLLRYANSHNNFTINFPDNPNGSVDGIAGLVNENGNIFGHMAHPEVSVYNSRNPNFFSNLDKERRTDRIFSSQYNETNHHDVGFKIFENIVNHLK